MPNSIIPTSRILSLTAPNIILRDYPLLDDSFIKKSRQVISDVIHGHNDRLLIVVGPCSIHDPSAALDYAQRLKKIADDLNEDVVIIMRVYFSKPRTTLGWKGLVSDPFLNETHDINQGIIIGRKLLLELHALQIICATEFLDPIIPQYFTDLISWVAIGARTVESQLHREIASGLNLPVGFKNNTHGNIQVAIDAIRTAQQNHHYFSIDPNGTGCLIQTKGNQTCHLILRGSINETNYSAEHIAFTINQLNKNLLAPFLMVDCSHGNSQKNYRLQKEVATNVADQICAGQRNIIGIMLESNLVEGKQHFLQHKDLIYGMSITDACIDWSSTEKILYKMAQSVRERRLKNIN